MTVIDTTATTIRDWLAAHHEQPEKVDCTALPAGWDSRPVAVTLALGYNVTCGGDVLAHFHYQDMPYRVRPAALIRDDDAGQRWDAFRRDMHAGNTTATVTHIGSRPSPCYRIVQTA